MTAPGVVVTTSTITPPRSVATDTGTAFLVGLFDRGPTATQVPYTEAYESQAAVEAVFGSKQSYGVCSDWVEKFFREGGHRVFIRRVVGPSAVKASLNITGTGTTLIYTAPSAGAWANSGGLTVAVANGPTGSSTRVLEIRIGGTLVYTSPEQTTRDLIASTFDTRYGTVATGGGSGLPTVAAAANVTSGADDRASITQTEVTAALALFPKDLGPGQVVSPDWNTAAAHLALDAHATTNNRFGVGDFANVTSASTLATAAASDVGHERLYTIAPWETIPGSASGSAGRTIPGSALYCARCAVVDASDGPNQAPAGDYGIASFSTGVTATFSDSERATLNAAGVNLIISRAGQVQVYGNRTQSTPANGGPELWASNARYRMSLVARCEQVGQRYVFARITRQTVDNFQTDLNALLLADYNNGDLYGDPDDDRPESAFNVSMAGNTALTAQDGRLLATVVYRPAPGAELVEIQITATAPTESVA